MTQNPNTSLELSASSRDADTDNSLPNGSWIYTQKKTIELYLKILEKTRQIGDKQKESNALGSLGVLYQSVGQYEQALDCIQSQLEITRAIGDRLEESNALGNLGIVYQSLGQYEKALDCLENQLEISREIGDRLGASNALGNLGIVYQSLGQYDRSLTYLENQLEIARQIGDRSGESHALGNLGVLRQSLGQYDQALIYLENQLKIAREIGNRLEESKIINNVAAIYQVQGLYKEAESDYQKSLEMNRQLFGDEHPEVAASLNNLAGLYLATARVKEAESCYQQALAMNERWLGTEHPNIATTLNNLAGLYETIGKFDRAKSFYLQAITIAKKSLGKNHPKTQTFTENYHYITMLSQLSEATRQVFLSYAWDEESEAIAKDLERAFQETDIKLVRDKTGRGYRGLISQFMQHLESGKCVIVLIGDQYLKSKNCMYEWLEISKDKKRFDLIFPIVLDDARIYHARERLQYIQYWEDQIRALEDSIKEVNLFNLQGIHNDLGLYTEIRNRIGGLVDTLQEMNSLTVHPEKNLSEVVKMIIRLVEKDADMSTDSNKTLRNIRNQQKMSILQFIRDHDGATSKRISGSVFDLDLDEVNYMFDILKSENLIEVIEDGVLSGDTERYATITSKGKVILKSYLSSSISGNFGAITEGAPSAIEIWRQKLAYLQQQEAIASNPSVKFELSQQIEECQRKICELGG
jgi:tetratricopeptide (TPR) repeat protein